MAANHKITVIIETDRACPEKAVLRKVARGTLDLEGVKNAVSLNLLLTGNREITKFNRKFLHRDGPTDVIAFCAKRGPGVNKLLKGFIGEIVVSVEMAERNAKEYANPLQKEIFLYIIHGILHLLGYEDESEKQRRAMGARQERILGQICTSL